MQTYPLALQANGAATTIQVQADLFVYESGTATPTTGDTRIAVKGDNGTEIVLRPGQRFRSPESATRFTISAYDKVSAIGGFIIIGSGEFDDANTKNTFTLDATFANKVEVTNDASKRVPVTLDPAQRVPVSLDQTQVLNIAGSTVNYTHTYKSTTANAGGTAMPLLAAAANVAGAVLEKFDMFVGSAGTQFYILAKATAPTSPLDGDVLHMGITVAGLTSLDVSKSGRVRAPAGMGIWYYVSAPDSVTTRTALLTAL